MEPTYSLDEIARTTDEIAVRRRFDRRNRFWLILLMIVFTFVVLIRILSFHRSNTVFEVLLGMANLAFIAAALFVVRDSWRESPSPAGRWLNNHVSASLITFVLLQYASILTLTRTTDDWVPWAITFPFFLLAVRMPVAELGLMFAMLTGGALLMPLFGARPFRHDEGTGFYIGMAVCNGVALAIALLGSYRMRRQVRREWNERRTQAREQIRMRDELRYARELQLSMLPECAPQIGWADLCAVSIPATEVGGDYYDYFVDGDRIALVCCDVAGHGMSSGLVLAALRSGFTLLRDELHDPAAVLRRLHDLVAQTSRRRMLVTVTVVLLDRATMQATIASAGHPPVILRRADGTVETINLFAPPLGVRLPVSIPQRRIAVASGDTFVLHSDGIYETLSADDETYGLDRLAAVVQDHDGTAEALRDAILKDVDAFRGSALPDDDVTVVVAKVL